MTIAAYEVSVPYRAGTEGYASFRIPAVVVTRKGTVLAFAEGRVASASDSGQIRIVLKRNPAPVVLDTGRILVPQVRNAADATEQRILRGGVSPADGRRVWLQHSDDDGVTWSAPREITQQVKKPGWRWYATAPGHAVRLRHRPHVGGPPAEGRGRHIVLANHCAPPTGFKAGVDRKHDVGHSLVGYTDSNRSLAPSRVEFCSAARPERSWAHWSPAFAARAATHVLHAVRSREGRVPNDQRCPTWPGCRRGPGPSLRWHGGSNSRYQVRRLRTHQRLYAATARVPQAAHLTITRSWRSSSRHAHSDLIRIDAGTVGLLYETGDFSAYSTITFRRIPVEELT